MSMRVCVAILLIAEGLVVAFGADGNVSTPAVAHFFNTVLPRVWWALIQITVGVVLLITRASARYEITGRYLAAAVTMIWCTVTVLPVLAHRPWMVLGTILWAGITALAASSRSGWAQRTGAAMWAAIAVAVAVAPDSAFMSPAVRDLFAWTGRPLIVLLCAVTAVFVGYRATWPSRASFTTSTATATLASAAWALVWAWPAFHGRPFNLIACTAWTWLAAVSLYGLGRRNHILLYARPLPLEKTVAAER